MIAWKALKALSPSWAVKHISESELRIDYAHGSELWIIGFDVRQRFEGKERWHGGVVDEAAQLPKEVFDNTISPALRDTKGPCHLIGKPEGKNDYYEFSQYAKQSGDPEWADFNWFSAEVLDPAEVEKERNRLDERTYRQEYEGSFESYEGRAYVYYDAAHHRKSQSFNSAFPVCVACDFNLDPCIWEIGQDKAGFISIQDEIKQRQTDIWKMCVELKRRLEQRIGQNCRKHAIIFYGDFEHGKTRSVSATATSWQIIRDEFIDWSAEFRLKGHPRIIDRVNAVNSKLRNARGVVQLGADPGCVELCKDFEMVDLGMLQSQTEKNKAGERTHASDTVGYWIEYEYPISKITTRVY